MSENIDYLFVFKNNGWWLKINTLEKLFDYYDKTSSRWDKAFSSLINSKEFTSHGMYHANALATAIGFYGVNNGLSAVEATCAVRASIMESQINEILNQKVIYINQNGGWHMGQDKTYSQWYRKKELVFPDFDKKQLKIEKFPGGEHFYAYLGDMQLRDGDILKWNTYKEAFDYAQQFLQEIK